MQLASFFALAAMAINQGLFISAGLVGHAPDADGSFVSKRQNVYEGVGNLIYLTSLSKLWLLTIESV